MDEFPLLRSLRSFFRYLTALVVIGCAGGGGFVFGTLEEMNRSLPNTEEMLAYRPRLATEIYSTEVRPGEAEGHTLLARIFQEDREPAALGDIPKAMQQATIAIEDRRFYDHRGISPRDMLRAAWVDITHGEAKQGASTLTQQLVSNTWLNKQKTWDRKIKEAVLALEVERKYSKDEILEMYLNQVCYGHGTYGVKTAARYYFGKLPSELSLAQCALLAGLPQSPTGYSPYRYPERAKARRNTVLAWMAREGYITQSQREEASSVSVREGLQPQRARGIAIRHAPYFTHLVIRELCDEYGEDAIYEGGLRIYTTLDMRAQKAAEEALTRGVESLRRSGEIKRGLMGQGGLACVEVRTGRVLAMVGGVGPYEKVQFNRAHPGPPRWGRQPGSSFKPYIWATALENGYGPNSSFSASPISIRLGPGTFWTPKNYTPRQSGNYTLRRALAESVNLVSVRIVQKLSISRVQRMAARMLDIPRERLRPVWAIALGASELSPLEQACGYCAFANSGMRPTRRLVRRIEDPEGKVVNYEPELDRVIRSTTAQSMLAMLRGAVTSGTGRRAGACGLPCGGKTGTTNSARDVWFVGFTPDISCAIWVGNDDNSPMPNGSGGDFCAPIWARFVREASKALELDGEFPEGPGVTGEKEGVTTPGATVTICVESGQRATPYCPATKEIPLKEGQRTPPFCTLHTREGTAKSNEPGSVTVQVCASSGMLAGPYCPASRTRVFRAGEAPPAMCTQHQGSHRDTGSGPEAAAPKSGGPEPEPATPKASETGAKGDTPAVPAGSETP